MSIRYLSSALRAARRPLPSATAALALLVVAGCSGSSGEEATPAATAEPLSGAQVMERAVAAVARAPSFRFELTHTRGATALTNGIQVDKASGAAVVPDRYSLDADTRIGRAYFRTQVVVLGEITYMRNPLADRWDRLTAEESPFGFFDPPALVAGIMEQIIGAALVSAPATVDGDYVVAGRLPATALRSLTGGVDESAVLDVSIRINAGTFLPGRADISGGATPAEPDDIERVIRLWDWGAPITLEAPE